MANSTLLVGWRRRWNRSLFQFLGRRVRAKVDIEDLAQETYLRLLRASDLSEVRNPQAYLLRVAHHVLVEWRDRQPPLEAVDALPEDLLVDDSTPELELQASLSQKRLQYTLEAVSPTMRAILLMRLRDELSCNDIAGRLDITTRQVKRYLARGYERLRVAVED
jgi:RNA polymerase sigma-70 factor (ECF subfamily)